MDRGKGTQGLQSRRFLLVERSGALLTLLRMRVNTYAIENCSHTCCTARNAMRHAWRRPMSGDG
ncbi:hypothetical protein I603_1705 [Erythrobacter dokdonensis DSW-74]|uniref:Uncharacterized protein n=1 Tax=Erythrobacter dokdonensis DSW-74 TaxID=1300349 RepID=A0A1A7BIM2_9SPHN|nr:hypothetical protein I603_1705 [Erythrobacter dokdonensis DSW-74]